MTRQRAELGTIKTGDIGDLVRTKISEDIVTAARKKQIGDQLVIESSALRNKEDDSIKFYERGTVSATKVSEGASIEDNAQSEPNYSAVLTAQAKKYAVYDAVTREAIEDARVDIVDGVTEEMGEALANKKDSIILERLANDNSTEETVWTSANTTGALANSPVLEITSCVNGSGDSVSYDYSPGNGSIKTDSSVDTLVTTYKYATAPNVTASTAETISMSDVSNAKYKITSARLTPDALVVSPKFISFLEQNSDYISAHTYSGELPQGVEGKLYNMNVIISDNLPGQTDSGGYIALLVDSDKGMPFLPKSDLNLERDDDPNEQVMKLYASERYAAGGSSEGSRLLRDNAVSVLAINHTL